MTGQDFIGPKYKKKKKLSLNTDIVLCHTDYGLFVFFSFPLFKSKLEYRIMYQQFSCCTDKSSALYSLACSSLLSLLTDSYIPLEPCIEIAWSRSTNWGGGGQNSVTLRLWLCEANSSLPPSIANSWLQAQTGPAHEPVFLKTTE